ncbi:MAG: ribonuclease HII [Ignavibacteria bacterium]|nr:ribonuclease HII [Ignavibacteria bacterium]
MLICGIDEAGRGPLAGPVVAAAVVFEKNVFIEHVTDSKSLSPIMREKLYYEIVKRCSEYKISVVDNHMIDSINILKATMLAMENCLINLTKKPSKVLIDGNYFKFENDRHLMYKFKKFIKGDEKIFQISAASILAKVERDRIMLQLDKLFPQYNFKKNKGYPTKEHICNIKKYGLSPVHRVTFCKKYL